MVLLSVCIYRGFELEPIKPRITKNQSCLNILSQRKELMMANLYVKAVPPVDLNRNTEWFTYPGVWTTYILILFFAWLLVLSIFGCSPGMAWTIVNLAHFAVRSYTLYFSVSVSGFWLKIVILHVGLVLKFLIVFGLCGFGGFWVKERIPMLWIVFIWACILFVCDFDDFALVIFLIAE